MADKPKEYERLPLTGGLNFRTGKCKPLAASKTLTDNHTEHQIQTAYFDWLRLYERQYPILSLVFAVPNGGHRHVAVAVKLKHEGVKTGIPDVCIPIPRKGYGSLWLEFKNQTGKLSENQKVFIAKLEDARNLVFVVRSWQEAAHRTIDYLDLPVKVL